MRQFFCQGPRFGHEITGGNGLPDHTPFFSLDGHLQPTPKHHAVDRFVTPEEFAGYEKAAYGKGFLMVSATPLTRSSYHAGDDFARLRANREAKLAKV